nr:hypothetical protein [Tanacetum cinerariifolium]
TYAPSTITPQRPSECDLDIVFELLHNKYLGGRPTEAPRAIPVVPLIQNLQVPNASISFQDFASVPTNSSNTLVSSHNIDATSQQHAQQQRNLTPSPTASAADNVPNVMFEEDLFVNPFGTPSTESIVASTQYVDPLNMHTFYQPYPHDYQWTKHHLLEQVIEEPSRQTVKEALTDPAWIDSMQEELHPFIRLDVWELVPSPDGIKPLTLKWIFLAYATHKGFTVYQMDVETAFLYGSLKEDVYVCQPEGFIDTDYPSRVYKLKKALYGLKQAPRAWYEELSTFLLQNGFSKGTIDPTLFTRLFDDDILVVQVYVDDIIFGSTDTRYATLFSDLMKSRFEMSMMGEMTFFLGLQVNQSPVKQDCTSLSTAESEYVSVYACCAQVLWMRAQLTNYGYHFDKILIYCDSKSAIAISCNLVQHSRTKHIVVQYYFIKEHVEKGTIELYFVKTDYQLAGIFTKAFPMDRFNYLVRRLRMRSLCPQELDHLA